MLSALLLETSPSSSLSSARRPVIAGKIAGARRLVDARKAVMRHPCHSATPEVLAFFLLTTGFERTTAHPFAKQGVLASNSCVHSRDAGRT